MEHIHLAGIIRRKRPRMLAMASIVLVLFVVSFYSQKADLVIQTGHTTLIETMVFSPDGKNLASGSLDTTIILWNVATGRQIRSLQGHTGRILALAFSPDGKRLASGGTDKSIRLWNVETGQQIKVLNGHAGKVQSVAFSPDGKTLLSGGGTALIGGGDIWNPTPLKPDSTIRIWDLETGQEARTVTGSTEGVNSVAFSPDGRTFISGGDDKLLRSWDARTGQPLKTFNGHTDQINSVAFSPDGRMLASASHDKTVRLWDFQSARRIKSLSGHPTQVEAVAFSSDGEVVFSRGSDIRSWNSRTGQLVKALDGVYHTSAISPDGNLFAMSTFIEDHIIELADAQSGEVIDRLIGRGSQIRSVAFSPDGAFVASAGFDRTVRSWALETGRMTSAMDPDLGLVFSVAFSPDGRTLATGGTDTKTKLRLWNVETGKLLATLQGHTDDVNAVVFSPDGTMVASGSDDKSVRVWNAKTGELIKAFVGHTGAVNSISFSPDGRTIASGSDNDAVIWSVETGAPLKKLDVLGSLGDVYSVAFSPDGRTLAVGGFSTAATLWDVETGQPKGRAFPDHSYYSLAFAPDGRTLVAGDGDGTIRILNVESGEEIKSIKGHTNTVGSLVFSPDGSLLVSGSSDGTVKLWKVENGVLLATLISLGRSGWPERFEWAVTTPDGRFDTNKDLEAIDGLYWVISDDPMVPKPLDLLMRQYYEPNLLIRLLKCDKANECEREFRPLPPIAYINRVQPSLQLPRMQN